MISKTMLSSAICAVLFASTSADAASRDQTRLKKFRSNVTTVSARPAPANVVSTPNATAAVLFDQLAGASSADYVDSEESSSSPYTDEAADDFVVPVADTSWTITSVKIKSRNIAFGTFTGPPQDPAHYVTTGNLTIYSNASGVPGTAVAACSVAGTALAWDGVDTVTVNLSGCTLSPGTYWLSFQAITDYTASQPYGYAVLTTATNLSPGVVQWQNPGQGIGDGAGGACGPATWAPASSSCWGGLAGLAFQLNGSRTTPVSLQHFDVE